MADGGSHDYTAAMAMRGDDCNRHHRFQQAAAEKIIQVVRVVGQHMVRGNGRHNP